MDKYKHYKKFVEKEKRITKHHKKLIVFTIFSLIVFFLFFFAFSGGDGLMGAVINDNGEYTNIDDLLQITADLAPFDDVLDIEGYVGKIKINSDNVNNFFYVGDEKFDLSRFEEVDMIISDYNGEISFDIDNILKLDGVATEVLINDISVTSKSDSDINVRFDGSVEYGFLKLNGVYIESLYYTASGMIKLDEGKILLDLDDEELEIENFIGDLRIIKNFLGMGGTQFSLDGYVEKLNVVGDSDISVI